jgi:putative DNA primase/helicase
MKGAGKSTAAIEDCARVTCGSRFLDGSQHPPGHAVYWSGEDSVKYVIKPRFMAAGGDPERCLMIETVALDDAGNRITRAFDPAIDMAGLLATLKKQPEPPLLVILDPIISVSKGDGNTATEVRSALHPVQDLAEQLGCAVIGITHFNKHSQGKPLIERFLGSQAWGAVARILVAFGTMTAGLQAGKHFTATVESNLVNARSMKSHLYELVTTTTINNAGKEIETVKIKWGDMSSSSAQDLMDLAELGAKEQKKQNKEDEAVAFLYEELSNGPRPKNEIETLGLARGITFYMIKKAAVKLGVAKKKGEKREDPWMWSLPEVKDEVEIEDR